MMEWLYTDSMRILIINNGTRRLEMLQAICSRYDTTTIEVTDLSSCSTTAFDAIILSGSYSHAVSDSAELYATEIELIQQTTVPVLGICLGFELICHAYGCQLVELADKVEGPASITPTEDGARIFQGTDPIKVHEAHRWAVDEVSKDLIVLAQSDNGIEAVKHKTRTLYGLQFHPENFTYVSDGKMVFENILAIFAKQAKKIQKADRATQKA